MRQPNNKFQQIYWDKTTNKQGLKYRRAREYTEAQKNNI